MAGYKGTPEVLKVTGFRTAHLDYVRAAILEMAASNLAAHTIVAQGVVLDILTSSKDEKMRLRAAQMLMNRTGLHEMTEHKVNVTHELGDRASMIAMLRARVKQNPALLDTLKEPIKKLLELPHQETIEAEFVEVDPELEAMLK